MTRYSEYWNQITDLAQRKKIQNRIAQRTYRNKLKRRIAELEQLNGVLNGETSFPQHEHDEEMSPYQRAPLSTAPNTSRGITPGTVTPRDRDIGTLSNRHAAIDGGSHHRNQFSEPQLRFQDNGSPPPYTSPMHPQRALPSPNSQMSPADLLGALPLQAATTSGDLIKAPFLPISTPLEPYDMNSVLREPQSIVSSIQSYDWGLDTSSDGFFQLLHDQPNNSVTASIGLLNLNVSPLQNHLSQPSDDRTTLHLAVENNRLHIVQLLLARHADIRAQDRQGHTALHIAAIRGHEELTGMLLSSYSSSSSSYSDDSTSQQADLTDMTDATGCTALHHAAENGYAGIVEILSVAGANPRAQNNAGATPLHLAVLKGREAVVVSLFLAVTTNSSPSSGDTLMSSSARSASPDNKSNDGSSSNSNGSSAAISPARSQNFERHQNRPTRTSSTSSQDRNTNASWSPPMGPLCDLPHIQDSNGATPIHLAAESGLSLPIISILLSAGASVNILDTIKGFSPLHYAAQNGHESVVGMLLESGASVRMKARCGWNALHLAAQRGHDGVVAMLLERGAEVDERVEGWNLC